MPDSLPLLKSPVSAAVRKLFPVVKRVGVRPISTHAKEIDIQLHDGSNDWYHDHLLACVVADARASALRTTGLLTSFP